MRDRLDLDRILRDILNSDNVYFQPPKNLSMKYPCIRYSVNDLDATRADDRLYIGKIGYEIIYIAKSTDMDIFEKIANIPYCRFNRQYISDNLYHNVFILYF